MKDAIRAKLAFKAWLQNKLELFLYSQHAEAWRSAALKGKCPKWHLEKSSGISWIAGTGKATICSGKLAHQRQNLM